MRVITKREIIRGIPESYRRNYSRYMSQRLSDGETPAQKLERLKALDLETCSAADVDAAIGSPTWTLNRCDECDKDSDILVCFGEPEDDEMGLKEICPGCLREALALAKPKEETA